jgi:hypothetical protein
MKELLTEFLATILKEAGKKRISTSVEDQPPGTVEPTAGGRFRAKQVGTNKVLYWGDKEMALAWARGQKDATGDDGDYRDADIGSNIPKDLWRKGKEASTLGLGATGTTSVIGSTSRATYGRDGSGALLQGEESSAQQALDNGYVKGESWVAPGNPGSCFNENISNEGALILERFPDLTEEQLTEVLFQRTRASVLGKQQSATSSVVGGLKVPKEITDKKEKDIYRSCILAARSARTKHDRSKQGEAILRENGTFSGEVTRSTFGGTAQNKEDLTTAIQEANAIYVYDEELGIVEIPKEQLIEWVQGSGGGENAADTVTLTVDENGNVLYDGWSDKKTLNDIQGNSTLRNEFVKSLEMLDSICGEPPNGKRSDQDDCVRARETIVAGQKSASEIENSYADLTAQMAKYFLDLPIERLSILGTAASKYAGTGSDPGTQEHFNNFAEQMDKFMSGKMPKGRMRTALDKFFTENPELKNVPKAQRLGVYFKALAYVAGEKYEDPKTKELKPVLSADFRKIVDRMAKREKLEMQATGTTIPPALDTAEQLSELRKQAFNVQKQTMEALDKLPATTSNGVQTTLGALLGFEDAMQSLHLDKINTPTPEDGESFIRQILRRNTQLVMEGVAVTPKILRDCLGVDNTAELEDRFELVFTERLTYSDRERTKVSGKTIVIYAINKEGKQIEIGERTYRAKDGPTSPTSTTVSWSGGMQDCFESKSKK